MRLFKFGRAVFIMGAIALLVCSFFNDVLPAKISPFPYKQAGLTTREAAAHLLGRFTYGARPGQLDSVVKTGIENWFSRQLDSDLKDDSLAKRLSIYDALNLSNTEVCLLYPQGSMIVSMAIKDSAISKDSVGKALNKKLYEDQIQAYMLKKGLKPPRELYRQFIDQNILRAVYSNNQLQEVMTDFWFNHFNVSFTKGESSRFIPAYERDVIRPNALGKFDKLLLSTAKSPAMLYFLDNFSSVAAAIPKNKPTSDTMQHEMLDQSAFSMVEGSEASATISAVSTNVPNKKALAGLNENYAREVIELHTLGVDGGYTQTDVTEAARILTGWTIYPIAALGVGSSMKSLVEKIGVENMQVKGFIHDGDFLFTPNRHDKKEKVVLGHRFEANGGYQEGVDLLELLAHHTSTAKFISKKLATRFVCDNPPQTLIDKMAKSFLDHEGDIKQVLITMVSSTEFWDKKFIREKIKSPFELAISAARGLNADVQDPYQLYNWIARMGQKMYYYQAPTGFPDRAQYWINTGALLNRMNFSLALATQQISGVTVNLATLTNNHEPGSPMEALGIYSKLLMPERNLDYTIKQLTPFMNDSKLIAQISHAPRPAEITPEKPTEGAPGDMMTMSVGSDQQETKLIAKEIPKAAPVVNNPILSQVMAIVLGSPEFQRR